jgi:proteasome lid subunit RPN8/RPN11
MVKIRHGTLEAVLLAARNTYPNEFLALLSSKKKGSGIIDEYVMLPSTYGSNFSTIRLDLMPYTGKGLGSIHSHPSPNARPSRGDLAAFRAMGEIHLITAYPFSFESTRAFDRFGKPLQLEVVE